MWKKQPLTVVVGQLSAHSRRIFRKRSRRAGAAGPGTALALERPRIFENRTVLPQNGLGLEKASVLPPKRSSSEHKRPWPQRGPKMFQSGPILLRKRSENLQKSLKNNRKKRSITETTEKHCKYEEKVPWFGWAVQGCRACNGKMHTPQKFIETKPQSAISGHLQ